MNSDGIKSTKDFVFFWHGPLGQWHSSPFVIQDQRYNCAEQYMMAMKAKLFKDEATFKLIMETKDPRQQKALGRKVKNFNEQVWYEQSRRIVYEANYAKFKSNARLAELLLGTGDKELAEASPYDRLWGIGMSVDHPDILNKNKWMGKNWLGQVLMQVRNDLRKL